MHRVHCNSPSRKKNILSVIAESLFAIYICTYTCTFDTRCSVPIVHAMYSNLFSRNAEAEIALRKTLRELTTNTTRRTAPLRGVRIAAALQLEFDVEKPEVENVLLCTEAR